MTQKKTKIVLKNKEKFSQNYSPLFLNNKNIYIPLKQREKSIWKNKNIWLVFSGILMGFLNGFFGGGGGMICVPILQKILGLDAKDSHATAIMIIFPLSLVSAFIYVIGGYISSLPLITVGLGVIAGGIVGAFALKFLPPKAIRIIFAIIMFAGGIKLII